MNTSKCSEITTMGDNEINWLAETVAIEYDLYAWRPSGLEIRASIKTAIELGQQAANLLCKSEFLQERTISEGLVS
jgi:hypothetical protein